MKDFDFVSYIDRLNQLFEDGRAAYDDFQEARDAARARAIDVQKRMDMTPARKAVIVEDATEAATAATNGIIELRASVEAASAAIQREFEKEVKDFLTSRPEDVDPASITLMNSGTMNADDLTALAAGNNPTMLKLIAKAARATPGGLALATSIDAYLDPQARADVFDQAAAKVSGAYNDFKGFGGVNATLWRSTDYKAARDGMAALSTYGGAADEG